MNAQKILQAAKELQPQMKANRRELHKHPELGHDLEFTKAFVKGKLEEMGYEPQDCGDSGLVVLVGGRKPGKCFLLRADMDALPIEEELELEFRSMHPGKMHSCGHDTHAAMLLGAARLLKDREDEIQGSVKLMFQPGEETMSGARSMVEDGVLENPPVDAALMMHSLIATHVPTGGVVVIDGGVSFSSCDKFQIRVKGKGGHGSMPDNAIDPITIASHIQIGLSELLSRELAPGTFGVVTVGAFHAGDADNIIPDMAVLRGTIRAGEAKVAEFLKRRVVEISENIAKAYRGEAFVEFSGSCPPLAINEAIAESAYCYMKEMFGQDAMYLSEKDPGGKVRPGSEDFAYVSSRVPAGSLNVGMGSLDEGHPYSAHHPKSFYDDSVLYRGAAAYTYMAMRWLEEHC